MDMVLAVVCLALTPGRQEKLFALHPKPLWQTQVDQETEMPVQDAILWCTMPKKCEPWEK